MLLQEARVRRTSGVGSRVETAKARMSGGRPAWNPRRVLDAWRSVMIGTTQDFRLDYPTRARPGWSEDSDEYFAYLVVVRLPSYGRARPVLVHHWIDGRPLHEFRVRQPGEDLRAALARLHWLDLMIGGRLLVAPEDMAWWRWTCFCIELRYDLQRDPFYGRPLFPAD